MTAPCRYRAFGRVLECDRPLPELPPANPSDVVDFRIRWSRELDVGRDVRWSVVGRTAANDPVVAVARAGGMLFMRFGAGVAVRVSPAGRIDVAPDTALDAAAVRHVLLDQALPLALAAAGETVLHASGVVIDDRAVLFVGEAGTGKSTLAATLAREGLDVFADDGVLIEERGQMVYAVASYPGLRLWPDAADNTRPESSAVLSLPGGKRRFVPAPHAALVADAAPVARVYTLAADDSKPQITQLTRRDAVVELVRHAFNAEPDNRMALQAQLERLVRLADRLEIWRAAYRRTFTDASAISSALIAHARGAAR